MSSSPASARSRRSARTVAAGLGVAGVTPTWQPGRASAADIVDSALSGPSRGASVGDWGFNSPDAMVLDGDDLFVANFGGAAPLTGSLTELDASTGRPVRVISSFYYQFDYPDALVAPDAMVLDSGDLFVADDGSLTEVDAATGALVRVISSSAYQFTGPDAMVLDGDDLFVANNNARCGGCGWVTELHASTGALVRVVSGSAHRFNEPVAMVLDRDDLFMANYDGGPHSSGSVIELHASTGAQVRFIWGSEPAKQPRPTSTTTSSTVATATTGPPATTTTTAMQAAGLESSPRRCGRFSQ